MDTKKPNLGEMEWYDESYEDKDGKRVNPFPGVRYLFSTTHLPKGKDKEKIYYVKYRTPDGRQRHEKVGRQFRDRMTPAKAAGIREARIAGRELPNRERREVQKAEKKAAKDAIASRWDISRLFDAYMKAKGKYPRRVTDEGNFMAHLVAVVGKKTPAELTSFDVDRIKRNMKKPRQVTLKSRKEGGEDRVVTKGSCKPGTVAVVLGFLVRLASFGVKRNLCEGIKFTVEIPRVGTVKTEQMNDEQMSAYLKAAAACENKVIGAFLTFELLTGMRLGEVRDLTWDAVNIQGGSAHIREPKGGKDQFIPLTPAAVDLLNQLPRDPDIQFVFQGVKGKKGKKSGRIGISTVARYGREFANAAGLPKGFRPSHGLRHSYASALASSGEVDLYTLQRLMTHKSPQMTARYAHLRDETLRRGADVMSRIVSSAVTAGQEKTETA